MAHRRLERLVRGLGASVKLVLQAVCILLIWKISYSPLNLYTRLTLCVGLVSFAYALS